MKRILAAVKYFLKNADIPLLALCVLSTVFGIVLISSATRSFETSKFVVVQSGALAIGIVLYILLSIIDVDVITDKWKWLFLFSIFFIALLIPFGVSGDTGNRSWLRFAGTGIQPAEVVKISFTLLLAKQICAIREKSGGISSVGSVAQLVAHLLFMLVMILVISSDAGIALVYVVIFIGMVFAAGLKLRWFAAGAAATAGAAPLLWKFVLREDQKERLLAPYLTEIDPTGLGITWQANRSKIALAAGRTWGQGLFQGTQTQSASASALPAKHTDFIFSVAGEELGIIGCLAIMLLLALIILRIVNVGVKSKNQMGFLICVGFAAMIFFQTFENMGMCIGLTPVIGLTLPFFSYGGSSIVTLFAAMGIVSCIKMHPTPRRTKYY